MKSCYCLLIPIVFLLSIVNLSAQSYSLYFDGVNDYVEIPNSNVFNLTNSFTIETYVKINAQGFRHNSIVSKAPNHGWDSGWELAYGQYNGNMFTLFGTPGGVNTTSSYQNPEFERWYHIAGVYDGVDWKIFVDGELDSATAIVNRPGSINFNGLPIVLGRRSANGLNTHFLKGLINSTKISNVVRYDAPFIPPGEFVSDSNTIGLWNMNEGTGNIIYDLSGNGNHGLIIGPTWSADVPGGSSSSLLLQSPNGGENWMIGAQHYITWISNDVSNVKIEYSIDNGNTWLEIVNSIPGSSGSYLWTVPNTPTQQGKVKISDASDSTVYDISNSSFQIDSYDPIAYYPFNGNANDESGNGYNGINYGATLTTDRFGQSGKAYLFDGLNDYIDLSNTEGLNFTTGGFTLAFWLSYTEGYEMIPLNKHLYSTYPLSGYGFSLYPAPRIGFYIHMDPGKGIYTNENYNDGKWHFVVGVYTGTMAKLYVDGELKGTINTAYNQFNNVPIRIGKFSSNNPDPSYLFKGKIDDIRIFSRPISETEITSLYHEGGWPISNITVQTPNGGENWIVGTQQNITWSSNEVNNVKIEYSTNSGVSWLTIINSTPSNGSHVWTIPNTPSSSCKVKITSLENPATNDESDNLFSIIQPSVTVSSPNGGEGWQIGTIQNITWTSSNVNNVKIEYTTNNGSSWIAVIASTPSDGLFEWTIPNTPSTQCKVKISDVANSNISGQSNNNFSIVDFIFYASIHADSIWTDADYDGLELGLVDGSGSYISQGTITNYEWYVNGEFITNGIAPTIELTTGTSIIKLIVNNDTGLSTSDSIYISVYASMLSTNGAILSGVSQYGNNFYVTSMNNGVYRIDSTGAILQSYLTGGSIQSSLCISNETGLMYVGSTDTRLYCFDNGLNSLWDRGLGGVVNNAASVNYSGEVVYVGANDNNTNLGFLKSIFASTGNPKWTFQTNGTILSSPIVIELLDSSNAVVRTIVYFGTTKGTIYAVEDLGSSYSLFWSATVNPDSAFVSSPAFSQEGMLYIGSKNGYLYRFTWDGIYQSGWKKYTGGPIVSSPIIDENGIVYIASGSGYVYGFDKDFTFNFDPVKTFYQNVGINGTPGIGPDGSLLVGCDNGKFFALNKDAAASEMPVKWYFQSSGPVYAPTLVTENGIVYIGSTNGDLFIMRDPGVGEKISLEGYEWPTFKGNNQRSKVLRLITQVSSLNENNNVVTSYDLSQNFPNPFNPSTKINYQLPEPSYITLKVYDVLGKEIVTIVCDEKAAGSYQVEFDASSLTSGVYFYQLRAGNFVETKKMLLLK